MSSPVGHSLAGYAVYCFWENPPTRHAVSLVILATLMANGPDLDFIPGILVGKPALYHQGISHSVGFAVVASLLVAAILRIPGTSAFARFSLCFLSYLTHLILDMLGPDRRWPYGIPLFWPLTEAHFLSPIQLLPGVRHWDPATTTGLQWLLNIFQPHNLRTIAVEILLVAPLVWLARHVTKTGWGPRDQGRR